GGSGGGVLGAAVARKSATASFQSSGPSSTPGRQWNCRSIKGESWASCARASGPLCRARRNSSPLFSVIAWPLVVLVTIAPAITIGLLFDVVDQDTQSSNVRPKQPVSSTHHPLTRRLTPCTPKHPAIRHTAQNARIA